MKSKIVLIRKIILFLFALTMLFPPISIVGPLSFDDIPSILAVFFGYFFILSNRIKLHVSKNFVVLGLFVYSLFSLYGSIINAETLKSFLFSISRALFRPFFDISIIVIIQSFYHGEEKDFLKDFFKIVSFVVIGEFIFSLFSILTNFNYIIYDENLNPKLLIGALRLNFLGVNFPRLGGTMDPNFLGGVMVFFTPLFVFKSLDERNFLNRLFYLLMAFFSFLMLSFTLTRSSYIALVAEVILVIWIFRKVGFSLVGLAFLIAFLFIFKPIYYRFFGVSTILGYTVKGMLAYRIALAKASLQAIFSNFFRFLFGVGAGNWLDNFIIKNLDYKFHFISNFFIEIRHSPHNNYLNIWVERGFFALVVFLITVLNILFKSFKIYKKEHKLIYIGFITGTFGIMVQGLSNSLFLIPGVMVYIWIFSSIFGIKVSQKENFVLKIKETFEGITLNKRKLLKQLFLILSFSVLLFIFYPFKYRLKLRGIPLHPTIRYGLVGENIMLVSGYTSPGGFQLCYLFLKKILEPLKKNKKINYYIAKDELTGYLEIGLYSKDKKLLEYLGFYLDNMVDSLNNVYKLVSTKPLLLLYDKLWHHKDFKIPKSKRVLLALKFWFLFLNTFVLVFVFHKLYLRWRQKYVERYHQA